MMQPKLYWIPTPASGRLATMARPRGGDWLADELTALRSLRVDTLVCLLTAGELVELDVQAESQLALTAGLHFMQFPIPDLAVPPLESATVQFIAQLAQLVRAGQTVTIHCRQGIGRSSLVAASVLTQLGVEPPAAWATITAARGRPVPDTEEQRQWVVRFTAAQAWLHPRKDQNVQY
jgi:protein-tyrosine phosphatase